MGIKAVIKVVVDYPPIYAEIAARFKVGPRTIFAWGDTIYNPGGGHITRDLIAHEEVHMIQQAGNPEAWWRRYLSDPEFLLSQEVEAYARQYQYICSENPNRNYRFQVLQALAMYLASPMYGNVTTIERAMELIKAR